MRVAAIDCGTNTIRLLIARTPDPGEGDGLVELERAMAYVRLGQGVDATGEFHADALVRTFAATEDFAGRIATADVDAVRFVATSAARDVSNREAFFTGVRERLGIAPEVISGDEEAALSFTGAVRGLDGLVDPVLVMDVGGGSTELVVGDSIGGTIRYGTSLDVGSVRLTERMFSSDPVPPAEWQAAADLVDRLLDAVPVDFATVGTWIGVAGTVTSLSAMAMELDHYDRARVHGSRIGREQLIMMAEQLARSTASERAMIPTLAPRRADVITAGALIAARVATRVRVDLRVSESDILDGIALRLAGLA